MAGILKDILVAEGDIKERKVMGLRDIIRMGIKGLLRNLLMPSVLKSSHVVPAVGTLYELSSSRQEGFYGGFVSLKWMKPGDTIDISFFIITQDGRERYLHSIYHGAQESPMVEVGPIFCRRGASFTLTQTEGVPKKYLFEFYRL